MLLKKPSHGNCLLNKLLNLNRAWVIFIFLKLIIPKYQGYKETSTKYIPKTGYFHDKTKIFKGKSSSALFNA